MKFPFQKPDITGVAVPLSALRSRSSFGIGEFPDLVAFGKWCQKCKIELIQLLPVNDTGFEASPYSALSAFALHPIYLRLEDIPGFEAIRAEAETLRKDNNEHLKVSHQDIWTRKLDLLKSLYKKSAPEPSEMESWIKENSWVKPYAVFCALKQKHQQAGWQSWSPEVRNIQPKDVERLWKELGSEVQFFVWLQKHCESQFKLAVGVLESLGVALKGDIPILLNEDSADVWYHGEYFDLSWRAGSPPDGSNPDGQNWGFPVYRWDALERDGFGWWKDRLKQAAKFYHAYRIDHVLGFFRIWATPQENFTAQLGLFQPTATLSREQLSQLGFDDGRIVWMSEPHIFGLEIRERLNAEAEQVVSSALVRVGKEDLYKFSPTIQGEKNLAALPVSDHAKACLIHWYRNRTLLMVDKNRFVPTANYFSTRAYDSLGNEERWNFERLIHETMDKAMKIWEGQGRKLLEFMKNTTDMLVCAEDLGTVPACVPIVLKDLGILGLKIIRWTRDWNTPGQPYYSVRSYPELSVCAPSVHDTSTLRQWWEEEKDHKGFLDAIGLSAEDEGPYTPLLAKKVIEGILSTRSKLCIFALQDLFALDESFRTSSPEQERVNLPGTVSPENWSYRMKPFIEELLDAKKFNTMLSAVMSKRKTR